MSENESQFILAAYRPNGLDRDDPAMAEALGSLDTDPRRRIAFEDQLDFDRAVAAALAGIPVPSGLRESILAGARFSGERGRPASGHRPAAAATDRAVPSGGWRAWLAAAAVVALLAGLTAWLADRGDSGEGEGPVAAAGSWKTGSLELLDSVVAGRTGFDLTGADSTRTRAWLREEFGHEISLPPTLAALPSVGCKCEESPDGRIALVCLDAGDGTIVHLTIYEGADSPGAGGSSSSTTELASEPSKATVESAGRWAIATWRRENHRFLLAAADEPAARQRLRELLAIGEA